MAEQRTVLVRKWTWCKWHGIPYPCRKSVEELRWCYTFELARHRCFGFVHQVEACESGREFHYWTGCFGWWHSWHLVTTPYTRCFENPLTDEGPCSLTDEFPSHVDTGPPGSIG